MENPNPGIEIENRNRKSESESKSNSKSEIQIQIKPKDWRCKPAVTTTVSRDWPGATDRSRESQKWRRSSAMPRLRCGACSTF
eukprot:scaffold4635_cov267-Pinguiococcus_pyrenoidosus.AAC.25